MFLYGSFCGCNGGEEMGEGGKKAQGFGLLCGRGGSRHANILPLPLLLVFTAPRGIFKEGRGGVSAEWKGGISGLVVARGNHAKKVGLDGECFIRFGEIGEELDIHKRKSLLCQREVRRKG